MDTPQPSKTMICTNPFSVDYLGHKHPSLRGTNKHDCEDGPTWAPGAASSAMASGVIADITHPLFVFLGESFWTKVVAFFIEVVNVFTSSMS